MPVLDSGTFANGVITYLIKPDLDELEQMVDISTGNGYLAKKSDS